MAKDINVGIEMIENQDFLNAYNYFNDILKDESNNIDAKYYCAFVDFFHLRKELFNDYTYFKYLVDKKTKYKETVLPLLVIACDELSLSSEVIKYGRMAISLDNPYLSDVRNLLIKALALSNDSNNHVEALALIDVLIKDDEDAPVEVYLQKVDIQIKFNDLDGAEKTVEEIFTKFNANASVYFIKGKLALANASISSKSDESSKKYLEDAINAFEISLQYDSSMSGSRLLLGECYALLGNIDKAFNALDAFRESIGKNLKDDQLSSFEADLVVEKVKLCETTKNWELGIKICEDYLKNNDSWKVYYSLGYIQNVTANTHDELMVALGNIKKAYYLNKDTFLLPDVVNLNTVLKRFEDNDEIINEAIKKEPDNGLLYYLLAENTARLNYDYDLLISLYQKAKTLNYLDEASHITHVSFLIDNPKKLEKSAKKILKNTINYSVWDQRRSAIRYLFGEFGYKQDIEKAYQILNHCNKIEPNEPCILTIYGRSIEFMGNALGAFEQYKKAYEIYKKEIHMTCNCANGYLAYSYLNGIGTNKNEELAKELIIEGINKDGMLSAGLVIYHYAYFALLGDSRFSLEKALQYLSSNFAFDRYDIVRYLLTNKVCDKLKIEHVYNEQMIKKCLSQVSKEFVKYYKQNKDLNVVYPYYKSF